MRKITRFEVWGVFFILLGIGMGVDEYFDLSLGKLFPAFCFILIGLSFFLPKDK